MNQTDPIASARALGGAFAGLLDAPTRIAGALAGAMTRTACGPCEVPPPCWEPRAAGTCCLELSPGSTGTIRVHIVNCGWTPQIYIVTALGKLAGLLTFAPTTIVLGPQESGTVLVTVHVPNGLKIGQRLTAPLIVRGCLNHFARIDIRVSDCTRCSCCDIVIDDCQDHIHHWYDHFYCPRPCQNLRGSTTGNVAGR